MYLHFSRLLLKLCCFSERQWGSSALCYKIYLTNREAWAVYMFGQSAHAVLTIKEWKARSNIWEFWVLSRWRSTQTQAPRIQNRGRFRGSNFPTLGQACLSIGQTSRPWGQHLCSKFATIPHVGCAQAFKVPTLSRGPPPLGHNIDSCITFGLRFIILF